MGRILPGDITKPFQARRAEQIGFRDSFATRVGESAAKSLLTPQGLATGVKLVAPFIKMGGGEEGLTEAALGLSPAAEVAAKRVTPPAAPGPQQTAVTDPAQQVTPVTDPAQQAPPAAPVPKTRGEQQRFISFNPIRRGPGAPTEGSDTEFLGLTSAEDEAILRAEAQDELDQILAEPDPEKRRQDLRQFFGSTTTGESLPQDYYLVDKKDLATDQEELADIIRNTPDPEQRKRDIREFQGSFFPGPPEPGSDLQAEIELQAKIDELNETYKDNPEIRQKLVTDLMRGKFKKQKADSYPFRGLTSSEGKKGPIYTIKDGQAVLDPEAKEYLIGMASRLGGDPDQIIRALIPESSMSTTSVNPDSGASGLIQFTDVAINEMKRRKLVPKELTKEAIRTMTAKEQLQLAEKYFGMYSKVADYSKPGEFSVAIFGPAGLGKKRSHVLYRKGKGKAGLQYSQNANVDSRDPKKRKGYITVDDYLKFKDRYVKLFQKKAKLPVFETKAAEPQKIEPIPEMAKSEPEVVESGIEDQTAQVGLPSDIPQDSSQGQVRPVVRRSLEALDQTFQAAEDQDRQGQQSQQQQSPMMEMTRDQLDVIRRRGGGDGSRPAPSPQEAAQIMFERRREDALREQEEKKRRSADSMLRSLAKVGSFRDQQRYIEGTLRRGDLDANQVQALTMAAGLIRDRMQPRTLAEALFAAERGTTVGDLWFDKTMRGVTGAKEQSGITPYQRAMLAQGERKFEDKKFETQRTLFMKDVTNNVQGIRRLRNAYDRMSADEALEKNILTDAQKHIAGMGRYEREMNKILAQARRPNANIDELEKRYSKVAAELTRAKSRLGSIVSKSKNADTVERYTGDIEVGDEGDVDAARQAMGQ